MDNQSRVVAALLSALGPELAGSGNEPRGEVRAVNPVNRETEFQVTGTAEVSRKADRVSTRVSVGSTKESVSDVTSSVSRRLDYILQAVRDNFISDKDISVTKFLRREGDQFRLDAEVVVNISEFRKIDQVRSVLLEKLDNSVCVGPPQFYHSGECLSEVRRRAYVSAVENAQQKAREVSQLLGQTLGPPLEVREEETKEWTSEDGGRGQGAAPLHLIPCVPTVTVSSRVCVSFSLRDKGGKKH